MSIKHSPLILGTEPIGKLLTKFAIPSIIAMTASSLYNMTDSIFIGHGVGPLGIAGLALTFPLMNLAAAFGSWVWEHPPWSPSNWGRRIMMGRTMYWGMCLL